MKKSMHLLLLLVGILLFCVIGIPSAVAAETDNFVIENITPASVDSNDVSVRYTAGRDCTLVTALYDGDGKLLQADADSVSAGQQRSVTVSMPAQLPEFYEIKAFLLDKDSSEPLCPAQSMDRRKSGGYTNAIAELDAVSGEITAVLSTQEACSLSLEILSENEENLLFRTNLPVEGELSLDSFSAACDFTFPQHYIIRGVLLDANGTALCNPFTNRSHTASHKAFAALTESDFEDSTVLDLQDANDGNFAVLSDDVTFVTAIGTADLTGSRWMLSGSVPAELQVGDKLCFLSDEGRYETVKVKDIALMDDGSVIVTPDEDASLSDFYQVIKINAAAGNDVPAGAEVCEDVSLMAGSAKEEVANIEMGPAIAINLPLAPGVTLSGSGKAGINLKFNYDAALWGEDYFEFVCIAKYQASVGLSASPGTSFKDEITIAEFTFAGLKDVADISAGLDLVTELSCEAKFGPQYTYTATAGCIYNSEDGSQTISEKRVTEGEMVLEGEVDATIGIRAAVKAALIDDLLKASLGAEAGVGAKYTANIATAPLPGTASYHACDLCFTGKPYGYFEVDFTVDYDINPFLKGSLLDLDFVKAEWSLGEKYFSMVNEEESLFCGVPESGSGSCPNRKYRAVFNTYLEGVHKPGYFVTVKNAEGQTVGSGNSTYSLYLYPGSYEAEADIEDITDNESFAIKDSAVTIDLSAAHYTLTGHVTDEETAQPLSGVSVAARKNGEIVGSTTTGSDGSYVLTLPENTYALSFTCENYKPLTQTLALNQNRTVHARLQLKGAEGTVSGTVTDKETGLGLGTALVTTTLPDGSSLSAVADSDGRYTLVLPADESYTIHFSAPDFEEASAVHTVVKDEVYSLSVSLEPKPCDIIVMVRNADGTPAAGATVSIPGQQLTASTDSDGSVSFTAKAGTYLITAETDDFSTSSTVRIVNGLSLTLTLEENYTNWRYDEPTRTLYIWGNGPMCAEVPWYNAAYHAQKAVITGLSSICEYAFCNLPDLTSVDIPSTVTVIEMCAFEECVSLTSVAFDNVTSIEWSAFSGCESLASAKLSGCLTTIKGHAFSGSGLISVEIPDSVTYMDNMAFAYCPALKTVTISNGLTALKPYVFEGCTALETVMGGENLTKIGRSAFDECESLKSIFLSDSLTLIDMEAFYGCKSLTEISIPHGVYYIGKSAFRSSGLASVSIPTSVTSLIDYAFDSCENLKHVYYAGTESQWKKISRGGSVFPSGCTIHYMG